MRIAKKQDRGLVISILVETFRDNPSVHNILKVVDDKHLNRLMGYAFDSILHTSGVYLSDDNRGVAVCYRPSLQSNNLYQLWLQLKLIFGVIGLFNISKALNNKKLILNQHPADGNYLNFWFLGILPQTGMGSVLEIRNAIFTKSKKEKLPIYLETSVEKNRRVYERYGFNVYSTISLGESTLYFLKRE